VWKYRGAEEEETILGVVQICRSGGLVLAPGMELLNQLLLLE